MTETTDGGAGHGGTGTGGSGGVFGSGGSGGLPSGGSGGVFGSGGSGGLLGSGGVVSNGGSSSTCYTATAPTPACGAALCGNGRIDSCSNCPDGGWGG